MYYLFYFLCIIYLLFSISISLLYIFFSLFSAYRPKSSRSLASSTALPSNTVTVTYCSSSTIIDIIIRKQSTDKKAIRKTDGRSLTLFHGTLQNGGGSLKWHQLFTRLKSFCIHQILSAPKRTNFRGCFLQAPCSCKWSTILYSVCYNHHWQYNFIN